VKLFYTHTQRKKNKTDCRWLTPVILATQEAEIRKIPFKDSPSKYFVRPYPEKTQYKKELVE
jgi:hypothetical protein